MPNPDPRLTDLAARIADGAPVDWTDAGETGALDPAVRDALRLLERVAEVHGAVGESPERSTGPAGYRAPFAALGTAPARWGALEVVAPIGSGAFGDVYRAWDPRLDRHVALKVLATRAEQPVATTSLSPTAIVDEGRLLARVRHPGVVTVYGTDEVEGRVGLWMELVEGRTLDEEVRERGPLPAAEVRQIGRHLADALAAVHRAGLIHRDVKAQNVMREPGGRTVLMDFGTGVVFDENAETRALAGTPLYLAPELIDGGVATTRSDAYALGVLLFHIATGDFPVRGRTLRELRGAHARGERRSVTTARPDLPRALAHIIDRALSVPPAARFADAGAMAAALAALDVRRLRLLQALGAAAITVTTGGGFWLWSWIGAPPPRPATGLVIEQVDPAIQARIAIRGPSAHAVVPCTERQTTQHLALCDLVKGTIIRRLREPKNDGVMYAFPLPRALISPDGRNVAYIWTRDAVGPDGATSQTDAIHMIGIDGSDDRELYRGFDLQLVRWMPDGQSIVVRDNAPRTGGYMRIATAGSGFSRLLDVPGGADRGDLSPDGRLLLFARVAAPGNRDLVAIDVTTGREVWQHAVASDDAEPKWTPDGRAIVFVSDRQGCQGLARLPVEHGQLQGRPQWLNDFGRTLTESIGFGSDGRLMLLQRPVPYSVYEAELDSASGGAIATRPLQSARCDASLGADWHPDGRTSAHIEARLTPGGPARLLIDPGSGSTREIPLPETFVQFAQARWSPDGGRLAVTYATGPSANGWAPSAALYVLDTLTGDLTLVARRVPFAGPAFRDPAWHPSTGEIYVRSGPAIERAGVGAPPQVVYRGPEGEVIDNGLAISATGRMAVGLRPQGTTTRVCIIRVIDPSGAPTYRRELKGSCQAVVWTHDDRTLLVGTAPAWGTSALWRVDPAADTVTPVELDALEPNFWTMSLSRDGRLLFTAGRPAQQPEMLFVTGIR